MLENSMSAFSEFSEGFKRTTAGVMLAGVLVALLLLGALEVSLSRGWLWRLDVGWLLSDPTDDWARAVWSVKRAERSGRGDYVFIIGGSGAREALVSDESVQAMLAAEGRPLFQFVNLGTRNQSLYESLVLVENLPPARHGLVVMALTPSLFRDGLTEAHDAVYGTRIPLYSHALVRMLESADLLPTPALPINVIRFRPKLGHYIKGRLAHRTLFRSLTYQHHFLLGTRPLRRVHLLPLLRKLSVQMRSFPANAAFNFAVLERSVRLAQHKGYRVLLVDLPRNPLSERVLYEPYLSSYRQRVHELSETTGASYRDLHLLYQFPPQYYYDHLHLLDWARTKFQDRFVGLLAEQLGT